MIEAGITQIGLAKTSGTQTLADSTKLDGTGSFTIGQTHAYTDAWFADNGFYREFTNPVTLTDDAKTLPGMSGSGRVRDLREAASLNGQLVTDVNGLSGLSRAQMKASLDSLIDHWADTSTMETSIQQAAGKNYVLFYLIPGMSVTDWFKIYATSTSTSMSSGSSGGTGGSGGYYAYTTRFMAMPATTFSMVEQATTCSMAVMTTTRFTAVTVTTGSSARPETTSCKAAMVTTPSTAEPATTPWMVEPETIISKAARVRIPTCSDSVPGRT